MRHTKQTLAEVLVARLSQGAVPIDGTYWREKSGTSWWQKTGVSTNREWVVFERASLDPPLRDTAAPPASNPGPRACCP